MWTAETAYGMTPQTPSYGVQSAPVGEPAVTDRLGTGWRRLLDPANPLLWLGVVLAVTLGAAGVAGSVRLGQAQLSVDVDRS